MLESVLVNEYGQLVPRSKRRVAVLAVTLLVPAGILSVAGPGHSLRAAAWTTAGLAVLAAAYSQRERAACPWRAVRRDLASVTQQRWPDAP